MSESPSHPSPQLLFETLNAYQRTAALQAGVELDVFSAIGSGAATAEAIARRCASPERGIRILCDSLTVLGFLDKREGAYFLTADSAAFLDRSSPAYLGGTVRFFLNPGLTGAFADLAATIRSGQVHQSGQGTTAPEHPVWIDFARAMGPMMLPIAEAMSGLVEFPAERAMRILDVSASHGAFGIALARRYPLARLVALDWEPVLAVTREHAAAAGLGERFDEIAGDAFTAELGSDYDVVLVPNFLHHFNPAACTGFLRRVRAAMRPGGTLVIVEFVPNEDRVSPPSSALFSLVMLGTTPEGDAYTFGDYQGMLGEAGFHGIRCLPLPPSAESAVLALA